MLGCCTTHKYTFASTLNQLDFLQFWYKIFHILPVKTLLKRPSERTQYGCHGKEKQGLAPLSEQQQCPHFNLLC